MKLNALLMLTCVLFAGVSTAIAQESVRLRFEVHKDGSPVAAPEVSMNSGSAGRFEVNDVGRFVFTPTVRGSDLAIAFDIRSGGKQFQPRLVISRNEPGSISWTSDTTTESFTLTVSWVR